MSKVGYNYQSFGTIYSMNDIRIHVIVPDNEVITDEKNEEINKIYQGVASKHNLKWASFKVKVVHSSEIE